MHQSILTRAIFADCIINSQLFRDAIYDAYINPVSIIRDAVKGIIERNSSTKIGAIKELREFSKGRVPEFFDAFPEIVKPHNYVSTFPEYLKETRLGLADAKYIIDSLTTV